MELLSTHNKLGHYDVRKTPHVFKGVHQGTSITNPIFRQATTCKVPLCQDFMLGKARLQSIGNTNSKPDINYSDVIKTMIYHQGSE